MNRTIASIQKELLGAQKWWNFARWPPNVFALTSILLGDSGIYRYVVSPPRKDFWPPKLLVGESWQECLEDTSQEWRRWALKRTAEKPSYLKYLKKLLSDLRTASDVKMSEIMKSPSHLSLASTILSLHVLADETCGGIGKAGIGQDEFDNIATRHLIDKNTLATISSECIRVLPKFRTPQVGITLRSLSHYLAIDRSEVDIEWYWDPYFVTEEEKRFNLLLIPWPFNIDAGDFRPSSNESYGISNPRSDGYFEFWPRTRFKIAHLEEAVNAATKRCRKVHGVVLPEAAVTEKELKSIEKVLSRFDIHFFLAGVRKQGGNHAVLGLRAPDRWDWIPQSKHHRWCINESQVRQYHLGASLHPGILWWEAIDVPQRSLTFVTGSSWLTMSHLICEDLARQDPISPVIRSVGPNLVIALLQDGPQMDKRWSARYAGVLADDPGSSVLTLTSLGMALRCKPPGEQSSPIVALWKDRRHGSRELTVDLNSQANSLLLSICALTSKEVSLDGRPRKLSTQSGIPSLDIGVASELVLAGVDQI